MRATYSPSTFGMHHISLRHGLRPFSANRRRTVSPDRLSWSVSLTIAPAKSSSVQRARPSGGLAQAAATHRASSSEDGTNRQMNQKSGAARSLSAQGFTEKQGQYLAFIYTYAHMFRRPPAEADMQRHFQVSPPSVHQMIVTLERNGLIRRQPGVARSIQILVAPKELPILDWLGINQSEPL